MTGQKILKPDFQKFGWIGIVCFCFFSFNVNAQVVITGKVINADTKDPLFPATILDKTTGKAAYADSTGFYRIVSFAGDQLAYRYVGFFTETYQVPKRLTNIIHNVQLIPKREKLKGLNVNALTPYQQDSLSRLKTFSYYLNKPVRSLVDKTTHHQGGFGLIFHPLTYFSKDERQKRHFHKMFQSYEKKAFIDSRFTPKLVKKLTGLRGDSLHWFMYKHRPTYDFTRYSSNLVFWSWIKIQYKMWANSNSAKK